MKFTCPETSKSLNIPDEMAGKTFRCPACGKPHAAPGEPAASALAPRRDYAASAAQSSADSAMPDPAETASRPAREQRAGGWQRDRARPAKGGAKSKLLTVAAVLAALLLAGGGYLYNRHQKTVAARDQIVSGLARADKLLRAGDTVNAGKVVKDAETTLGLNGSLLDAAEYDKFNRDLVAGKTRVQVLGEAKEIFAGATDNLEQTVKSASALLERKEVQADAFLAGEVQKGIESGVLKRLDEVGVASAKPEAALADYKEMAEKYSSCLKGENANRISAARDAYTEKARKKLTSDIEADFARLPAMLDDGDIEKAFAFLDETGKKVTAQPEEIAAPVRKDFDALAAALKEGKVLEGGIKVPAKAGEALKQVLLLQKDVATAESLSGEVGAVERLAELLQDIEQHKTPSDKAYQYAQRRVYAITQESNARRGMLEAMANSKGGVGYLATLVRRIALKPGVKLLGVGVENNAFQARLDIDGVETLLQVGNEDIQRRAITCVAGGFRFTYSFPCFTSRPLRDSARFAKQMLEAGQTPVKFPTLRVVEGPQEPLALAETGNELYCLYQGKFTKAEKTGQSATQAMTDFTQAAKALRDGIMADAAIGDDLRQALDPVLNGTYSKLDERDHLSGDFCRRVIAGDYLEKHVPKLGDSHKKTLEAYRKALAALGQGIMEFTFKAANGEEIAAFADLSVALGQGNITGGDQDSGLGGNSEYNWREYNADGTTSFSQPLPERQIDPFFLVSTYAGKHESPPAGEPDKVEVYHLANGLVATWKKGETELSGSDEAWNAAIADDLVEKFMPNCGPAGWGLALHVPLYDGDGNPLAVVTKHGKLESPDFDSIADPAARRKAQDEWLDKCARVFATPGEQALFFRHLATYALDSPITSDNELLGSHLGAGDFHQTVYQMLDRKVAGKFVGDCDDLAEFYQVATRRQGKLSHVLAVPSHALCGYVDVTETGGAKKYGLVLLQTGPAMLFEADTLDKAVEAGIRSFDSSEGRAHFTVESVPFLFRFADEQTRTHYWLSDRIFVDKDYAETMIRVQGYWHFHFYSTGIHTMTEMLKTDRTPSNYSEIAGLYRSVGFYKEAIENYQKEVELSGNDDTVHLEALVSVASMHQRDKDYAAAQKSIDDISAIMKQFLMQHANAEYGRTLNGRIETAGTLLEMDRPAKALEFIKLDYQQFFLRTGTLPQFMLQTLVPIYAEIRDHEADGAKLSPEEESAKKELEPMLESSFQKGFFSPDDSFNQVEGKYFLLGSYAVAKMGKQKGLAKLMEDGPYPAGERDDSKRGGEITDEDWSWFRVCPALYYSYAADMADLSQPEKLNLAGVPPLAAAAKRAFEHGKKLGSLVIAEGQMAQLEVLCAILNKDSAAIEAAFKTAREKDWSEYYDDTATAFGLYCGFLPLDKMTEWMGIFHKYFPGRQHYFKVSYRAIDRQAYDHALVAARESAKFFPEVKEMAQEAAYMEELVKELKKREEERKKRTGTGAAAEKKPAEAK